MSVTETKNIPYAQGVVVRADGALTITQTDKNGIVWTMFECGEDGTEGSEAYFTSISSSMQICREESVHYTLTPTFSRGSSRGAAAAGNAGSTTNSNLVIGHAAADAVAAVCTLTLGDLATGGTLTDSNGQSVELQNPHKYADGWVAMPDATAAGTIAFGEHEAIEFEEKKGTKASGTFYISSPEETISVWNGDNEYSVALPEHYDSSVDEWNSAFLAAGCGLVCSALESHGEVEVSVEAETAGEAGNGISIEVHGDVPITLEGGQDARAPQEVVDALNASEDCPAVATLDADEGGISFTAKEYGVNDTIVVTGSLFSDEDGMSGGHGDYTVAELVTAISGEFSDITPAAGEAEGTITLTATTAGKAANAITYTATGCFGSGITRQGSTTRGKDAVEQTDYKIYLNGEELDEEPAPLPTVLTPTTAMRNGGVYTVTANATAQVYTAITLANNATAEIWLTCTSDDNSVALPGSSEGWIWLDAMPDMATGKTYAVAARNVGGAVLARPIYEYTTPAQS